MKFFRDIYHWLKGKKEFKPTTETVTVEVKPTIKRKHEPQTILSKGGTRYRLIKHDANKKANSPAYVQKIILKAA